MSPMLSLERVIEELRRTGGNRLVLASDTEPRVMGRQGEVSLGYRVSHRDLTALVESIVPASRFADLVMMEPVTFDLRVPAGEMEVRVVPGPSIWRVTFSVRGERLEPLPAGAGSDGAASDASSPEAEAAADAPSPSPSPSQIALPEREIGSPAPTGAPAPPGSTRRAVDSYDSLDLEGFAVGKAAEPPPAATPGPGVSALAGRAKDSDPGWSRPSLDGALVRSRKTSEVEVLVTSETEERSRRGASFATGSTIQLSADDLAAVAARTASVALGRPVDGAADPDPSPSEAPPSQSGPTQAPVGPRSPSGTHGVVQPIEISFREDEVPRVRIEALDRLLERAFGAGATSVLLRDQRLPAMGVADRVEPLPGARAEDGSLVQRILDLAASPSHVGQLDIEGFCRFVYRPGGGGGLVRCTLVRDGGAVAAWLRHIGDEHLPVQSSRWLPASVRNTVPESGLVLVAGASGHGKTTTATALAALCHQASTQTLVVADPLERRLPADSVGILQRQIPDDVPNAGRALGDALRLEARLVLVDIPRPEAHVLELLSLAGQGRLVLCTWIGPDGPAAVEALMDALPASMSPVERSRRARALRSVVTVQLVPARDRGVQPIFEILPVNALLLEAVAHGRMGSQTGNWDLRTLSFEGSLASLRSRGLI